jgi:hypothetical protein
MSKILPFSFSGGNAPVLDAKQMPDNVAELLQNLELTEQGSWKAIKSPQLLEIPTNGALPSFITGYTAIYQWFPSYVPEGCIDNYVFVVFYENGDVNLVYRGDLGDGDWEVSELTTFYGLYDNRTFYHSPNQMYTLSGTGLSGSIVRITAPSKFKISHTPDDEDSWGETLDAAIVGGALNYDVYVRYYPTSVSPATGTISHVIDDASQSNLYLNVTGEIAESILYLQGTLDAFEAICLDKEYLPSEHQHYSIIGSLLHGETVTVTAPTYFEVTTTPEVEESWSSSIELPITTGSINTTVYVRFAPENLNNQSGNISHSTLDCDTLYMAVSGTVEEQFTDIPQDQLILQLENTHHVTLNGDLVHIDSWETRKPDSPRLSFEAPVSSQRPSLTTSPEDIMADYPTIHFSIASNYTHNVSNSTGATTESSYPGVTAVLLTKPITSTQTAYYLSSGLYLCAILHDQLLAPPSPSLGIIYPNLSGGSLNYTQMRVIMQNYAYPPTTNTVVYTVPDLRDGQHLIIVTVSSGGSVNLYIDGVSYGKMSGLNWRMTKPRYASIGQHIIGNSECRQSSSQKVAAFAAYQKVINATEINQIIGYIRYKYGLEI